MRRLAGSCIRRIQYNVIYCICGIRSPLRIISSAGYIVYRIIDVSRCISSNIDCSNLTISFSNFHLNISTIGASLCRIKCIDCRGDVGSIGERLESSLRGQRGGRSGTVKTY